MRPTLKARPRSAPSRCDPAAPEIPDVTPDAKGDDRADGKGAVKETGDVKERGAVKERGDVTTDVRSDVKADVTPESTPTVSLPDGAQAGWYPDSTNPGLMRYWDGFHLTGQVLHVHARAEDRDPSIPPRNSSDGGDQSARSPRPADLPTPSRSTGPAFDRPRSLAGRSEKVGVEPSPSPADSQPVDAPPSSAPAVSSISALTADTEHLSPKRPDERGATEAVAQRPGHADRDKDDRITGPLAAAVLQSDEKEKGDKSDKGGLRDAEPHKVAAPQSPKSHPVDDDVRNWAAMTETAVARAKAVDTPEAWQQAAQAAIVVSEMAETMQVAAEVAQLAEQKTRAAEEAEHQARIATQADTEAKEVVRQTSRAAQEATVAAKAAARNAAAAEQKAEELKDIVATAHRANTPEAWQKARQLAASPAAANPH